MKFIEPNTIRVVIPADTRLTRQWLGKDVYRAKRLAADCTVDIDIDEAAVLALAKQALRNRSRKAKDGPLTARPLVPPKVGEGPEDRNGRPLTADQVIRALAAPAEQDPLIAAQERALAEAQRS